MPLAQLVITQPRMPVEMSWTRLDDLWCERQDLASLSFDVRWHYLCMIQFASRADIRDGLLRGVDARRCSDVEEPGAALAALTEAGLLAVAEGGYFRLTEVDSHLPSDATRRRGELAKERQRKKRAHDRGDHARCSISQCENAPARDEAANVTRDSHADVTRDIGTGRDGTGRAINTPTSTDAGMTWPTAMPGRPGEYTHNSSSDAA